MVAEIFWLDEARDDLSTILEHIAAENPAAAAKYVHGVEAAIGRLADYPSLGRRYNDQFRCIVYRNHLIFYRVSDKMNVVEIAAVIDGRRDFEKLLAADD